MPYAITPHYWIGSSRPGIPKDLEISSLVHQAVESGKSEKPYILMGNPGSGKTTLMALTAKNVVDPRGGNISYRTRHLWKDHRVLWTHAAEFCHDIKKEIDLTRKYEDFDDNYSATGLSAFVDCLFIDDLGVEQETDFNRDIITTLIDVRYRSGKPTWFTTNLQTNEINTRYGERTLSRLMEMVDLVKVEGVDRRLHIRETRETVGWA